MKNTMIGVDLAKNVIVLHGVSMNGHVKFRKKLSRLQFQKFMTEHPSAVVVMEACGSAHYWAREMTRLGHEVKLIAPQYVKPFVKRHKNDAADAEAIVIAAQRPEMRFVEPKGMSAREFDRQLKEQMGTINKMTADDMAYAHWVLEKAGTTNLLRDPGAQRAARAAYEQQLVAQGMSEADVAKKMASVNATHFLDMVAGGDPSKVGIGAADVNQEIGRQWIRDGRAESLKEEAADMRRGGLSDEKMNVELKRC